MTALLQNQGYLYTFSKDSFKKGEVKLQEYEHGNRNKNMILTLIADDHPYLIHGVEADLNKDPKIKIVGNVGSYDELIEKASKLRPNIVLLDLRMPGCDKYDLNHYTTALKAIGNCKIIIFSNETGWARIHRCLEMGASAYIEKALGIGRLAEFIHRVYEDEELVIFTAEELPQVQFSPRQREILHHVADGKENDEIALSLNLELKTVQSYVNEVKVKLSQAFGIYPLRARTFLLLASKLGFGSKVR